MNFKAIFAKFNISKQCSQYGLSLWQCPQFIFLVLGMVIIIAMLLAYIIGARYIEKPEMIFLVVSVTTSVLLTIDFIITRSFEKLAEANRMKSEFVNIVSHQLRTPISNLKWGIDFLISEDHSREKQLDYLGILKDNTERMADLVSNLLIVARIEQGTIPFKKIESSLENLIKEVIKDFEHFARANNVEIKFKPGENLPLILIDPTYVRLIIENFLDNAIRYTPSHTSSNNSKTEEIKGKIKVTVLKEKRYLCFKIQDNGLGIPKADQKYIFQKFFRAKNILKHRAYGNGLGLYIVKAIAEQSGGKVGFESKKNEGTTFWFTIPIFTS